MQLAFVITQMVAMEYLSKRHTFGRLRCNPCETDLYVNADRKNTILPVQSSSYSDV